MEFRQKLGGNKYCGRYIDFSHSFILIPLLFPLVLSIDNAPVLMYTFVYIYSRFGGVSQLYVGFLRLFGRFVLGLIQLWCIYAIFYVLVVYVGVLIKAVI